MEERPWASGPAAWERVWGQPALPACAPPVPRLCPADVRWMGKLRPGAGSKQKNKPFLICKVTQGSSRFYSRSLVLEKGMLL